MLILAQIYLWEYIRVLFDLYHFLKKLVPQCDSQTLIQTFRGNPGLQMLQALFNKVMPD